MRLSSEILTSIWPALTEFTKSKLLDCHVECRVQPLISFRDPFVIGLQCFRLLQTHFHHKPKLAHFCNADTFTAHVQKSVICFSCSHVTDLATDDAIILPIIQ